MAFFAAETPALVHTLAGWPWVTTHSAAVHSFAALMIAWVIGLVALESPAAMSLRDWFAKVDGVN
jgi:hypothetical protein